MAQIFPIDFDEKLTIANWDYILFSDSEDGNKIKKAQYSNLKWEKWDTWARINSASFSWDDIVFSETDWSSVTLANAVNTLTWPQWEEWPTWPTWNWIASITSSKVWKTTTVTITETNTNVDTFQIEDWADGQWDVNWPASSTDGDLAMFDGATWKLIKDGWALTTKVFTLANINDTTNAQAAYDWYKAGKMAVILYSGKYYFFKWTWANSVFFAVNEYTPLDNTNVTSLVQKTLTLVLSWTTVTSISSWNMSMTGYNVLKTGKDYSTPYTPQYDGSPATKKYVDDSVADLMWLWKFLSLWDSSTGQPISFPLTTPYTYTTWDYFLVETVSSATPPVNYKPNGSSYTGTASSTTESDEVEIWDIYIYDWTTWLLAINHWKTVSFANLAGSPSDNTALSNALWAKQDSLTLPATPTQWHLVTWGADNETLVDWWAVPTWFTPWGTATTGYVVTKTAGGYEWQAPTGWIEVDSASPIQLTKIWAGSQSAYDNLWSYDSTTVYLTI